MEMITPVAAAPLFQEHLIPSEIPSNRRVNGLHRHIVWASIKLRIFYFACIILRDPRKIRAIYKAMLQLRSNVWGGDLKKIYRVNGKYYFNQYTPGWPSRAYDALIRSELRRQAAPEAVKERLSFIFLAITRKCPLRCEHCFEWDNLNRAESFTREDLFRTIDLYEREGVLQVHFSGGEPMVRIKDLLELVRYASPKMECWVLTSGFNFSEMAATRLKRAGCKGIVVSIDHYIPEMHNLFRGRTGSFEQAVAAVKAARKAGLLTSVSICATKAFIEGGHLLPYMDFAASLGVQFVQVLEPRSIGHYKDQEVHLEEKHIAELEHLFTTINHLALYRHYPTMLYHGFHQRRVGCCSGSRSVYIDSAGDVHACPFCHTKSYNIIDIIREGTKSLPEKENACPRYGRIA